VDSIQNSRYGVENGRLEDSNIFHQLKGIATVVADRIANSNRFNESTLLISVSEGQVGNNYIVGSVANFAIVPEIRVGKKAVMSDFSSLGITSGT
jgi:hypothetical protein